MFMDQILNIMDIFPLRNRKIFSELTNFLNN